MNRFEPMHFATRAIHVGQEPDPTTGATVPPIYATSTYTQSSPGEHKGYDYSRTRNPTRVMLEDALCSLEGGAACACFSSGCAATTALLATLSPGDKVLAYADVYGGTFRLMKRVFETFGVAPVFTEDTSPQAFAKLMDPRTKLVWLESPTNPLLRVLDIEAVAKVAHAGGAKVCVDNTFATPVLQLPIKLGADYVLHSTTKYIGGHSDVVGGAIVMRDKALQEKIAFLQNSLGGVPGPFDCFLQQRGLKTLAVRMERHCANAMRLAEHFREHRKLSRVLYPFLDSHPDVAVAKKQMRGGDGFSGGGGMVTIVLKDGWEATKRFCSSLRVFSLAESLGGVESLCCHPASMTHGSIPKEIREGRGITDGLVRLSVGIEHVDDLIADVEQALANA